MVFNKNRDSTVFLKCSIEKTFKVVIHNSLKINVIFRFSELWDDSNIVYEKSIATSKEKYGNL